MYIVGIIGQSGSGKTTLASELRAQLGDKCSSLSLDSYYIPRRPEQTLENFRENNFDAPNAFDYRLLRRHLLMLLRGQPIPAITFNFRTGLREENGTMIQPSEYLVFEGILIGEEKVRRLFSTLIFVNTNSGTCIARRAIRDRKERDYPMETTMELYERVLRPSYEANIKPHKLEADILFDNNRPQKN